MENLRRRAWLSLAGLTVVMGLVLFLSAGTWRYWEGWIYLSIVFGASAITTFDLMQRDPALLARRMRGRKHPGSRRRPDHTLDHDTPSDRKPGWPRALVARSDPHQTALGSAGSIDDLPDKST